MLARDAERVTRRLLGDGKREGQELRYGDAFGSAGKSLGVHLTGDKAGVWCDFASGESGDLLDLWAQSKGCDLSTAIREAKDYLGLRDVPLSGSRPEAKPLPRPAGLQGLGAAATHWLREERKLSPEAIVAYKLTQSGPNAIAFPFLLPDNTLVGMKFRKLDADEYWAAKDSSKILFGWQAIPANARAVVLCEGELKALAWWDYGHPALSVPFGGGDKGKQDWIELEYDRLARFDLIYLAMDQDEAGRKASDMILQRLGPERCAVVTLPLPPEPGSKCINACLRHGVSRAAIAAAIQSARPRDPEELRSAADYAEEVAAMFVPRQSEEGIRTPWAKIGDHLIFRPSELTVIAGINGHGKSQAVGFMAADAMAKGARVCVASLEFKVAAWMQRLCRQIAAIKDPSSDFARTISNWLGNGRLWAFDAQGTADWRRMLEVFRYARRRYGIDLFVIDNLTGLGIGEEDYQGQKALALSLSNFARDEGCHVWLVHHIRKGNSEHEQPDKMDIKGSGAITDLASTVLTVWRNKAKELKRKEAAAINARLSDEVFKMPDVRISCSKQRNYFGPGDGEPSIRLWWNGDCFHYLASPDHTPRPIVAVQRLEQSHA
jgi:twinkle protein